MALSLRLESIISLIKPANLLVDIGTDHGLLLIECVNQNIISYGIGIDNKKGPLAIAQRNINNANLDDRISLLLSEGATSLTTKADTWVIAGLGGETILEIIEQSLDKAQALKQLVLAPHSKIDLVRKQLALLGFTIEEELLVEDDKFYIILSVHYDGLSKELSLRDQLLGKLPKDATYYKYIIDLINKLSDIIEKQSIPNKYYQEVLEIFNQEFYSNQQDQKGLEN
ncbi:MAG: SAM-dependent methyltransferase [Erysipelothrix sp.]|nr:SAM-dependent methyltransferase [Erysipelothrix sp.]